MVERVASELAAKVGLSFAALASEDVNGIYGKEHWRGLARAAIAAMRDPTEAMLDQGWAAFSPPLPQIGGQYAMWTAMIDAALGGEK